MKIQIANKNDEIVGYKERDETTLEDIRRIINLNIFNEKGELLIAKRHFSKTISPNKWGPSVQGTMEEGDTYDSLAIKEAEEEIGLKNIKPIFYKKVFYDIGSARRFASIYYLTINSDTHFTLQADEVSDIRWIGISELESWFKEKPEDFVASFKIHFSLMKEIYETKN